MAGVILAPSAVSIECFTQYINVYYNSLLKSQRKYLLYQKGLLSNTLFIKDRLKYTWISFITHTCVCWIRFNTCPTDTHRCLHPNCKDWELSPAHQPSLRGEHHSLHTKSVPCASTVWRRSFPSLSRP